MTENITSELEAILPVPLALEELAPDCVWSMEGNLYENLVWESDESLKPSKEETLTKAKEIHDARPMQALRMVRDARLKEVDWVTLRSIRTKTEIPLDWQNYMQQLADLPANSDPKLVDGQLINVEWPKRPDGKEPITPPGIIV